MQQDDLASVNINHLIAANDWQERYRLLTHWGKLILPKPSIRSSEWRVQGCETPAWLAHQQQVECYIFFFDSDSKIINGIAAVLLVAINHQTAAAIQQIDLRALLQQAQLEKHLTPSRSNGINALIQHIYAYVQH